MKDVSKMSHMHLLKVLKECPASEYFGWNEARLNEQSLTLTKARMYAIKMI